MYINMVNSYYKLLIMEAYNKETLRKLLKDFYNLTNIKICIYDASGNEVCFYPSKYLPFCRLLRENDIYNQKCMKCDKKALDFCKENKRQYSYICHAGLFECISPILYNEEIVGYIFAGQIKTNSSSFLIKNIDKDCTDLKKEYENLPFIDESKINSAINILNACTGYEYLSNVIKLMDNKLEYSIELFINDNIKSNITIEQLCDEFHVSRNEIYSLFEKYFRMTPANYIKKAKIKKACELLNHTNLKVSTIGTLIGIEDYNYFSKVFKKEMKISPSEYRKKL